MARNERSTYRRGARIVVPVSVLCLVVAAIRVWIATRPPKLRVQLVLETDAVAARVAEDMQRTADRCAEAGWDAKECALLIHLTDPVEGGTESPR